MLLPPPNCNCSAKRKVEKREEQQRMIKFLHGLNSVYERARSQILLLDPLPDVDRAYSMIVQVEDEMSLNHEMSDGQNMMAMNIGEAGGYSNPIMAVGERPNQFKRRLTKEERKRLKCRHCHETGQAIDECFKLHGVPDWYKRLKENRERYEANFADNQEDATSSYSGYEQRNTGVDISRIIQSEISKYMANLGNQTVLQGSGVQNGVGTGGKGNVNIYMFSSHFGSCRCWKMELGLLKNIAINMNA